jgi:hypothetical protein
MYSIKIPKAGFLYKKKLKNGLCEMWLWGLLDISTCRQTYKWNKQAQSPFFKKRILQKVFVSLLLIFFMFIASL